MSILIDHWPLIAAAADILLAGYASAHVILRKRETRAAVAWVGLIWLVPFVGPALYAVLGVNRIRRHASALRRRIRPVDPGWAGERIDAEGLALRLPPALQHLALLERIVERVTERPLLGGNRVECLVDGDAAYPAMLEAIEDASRSVALASYIFNVDRAGNLFLDALARAVRRGVQVRVLIDAVGARYSFASMLRALRRAGVRASPFMPTLLPRRLPFLNLRNHRKMLVVDGRLGFTGGMNIKEDGLLRSKPKSPVRDVHFRIEGPVVAEIQQAFAEDWDFSTGEALSGVAWFPPLEPKGTVFARGITDGPDEAFEKLRWTLLAALGQARTRIRIATPYFLPDAGLITALNLAAMRGVSVDILLPSRGNLRLVQWASTALLWQVLERGCRIHLSPPPFDHMKLMVVDAAWTLFGSSNWDPRSLRLNFEFDVECHDPDLGARMDALLEERIRDSRPLTLADVDGRPLLRRLRDGSARLLQPFL
jgi:cardiolipin synthase